MSSDYHPQSNGQTEVTNQSFGNLLHCLVGDNIKTWDAKLPQAEFAHNHAFNQSLGFSPFQVIYGTVPRDPVDLSTLPDHTRIHGDAAKFVDSFTHLPEQAITNLEASSANYKRHVDKHRRRLVFEVGDFVWAYLKRDRMSAHAYNKLKAKKISLLEVLERINDTSDVFNVKYLSRFVSDPTGPDSRWNPSHPGRPDVASSSSLAPT